MRKGRGSLALPHTLPRIFCTAAAPCSWGSCSDPLLFVPRLGECITPTFVDGSNGRGIASELIDALRMIMHRQVLYVRDVVRVVTGSRRGSASEVSGPGQRGRRLGVELRLVQSTCCSHSNFVVSASITVNCGIVYAVATCHGTKAVSSELDFAGRGHRLVCRPVETSETRRSWRDIPQVQYVSGDCTGGGHAASGFGWGVQI